MLKCNSDLQCSQELQFMYCFIDNIHCFNKQDLDQTQFHHKHFIDLFVCGVKIEQVQKENMKEAWGQSLALTGWQRESL